MDLARTFTTQCLLPELQRTIEIELQKAVDEAVNRAIEDVFKVVRAKLGQMAISLLSEYDMRRAGQDLVIKVRVADAPQT